MQPGETIAPQARPAATLLPSGQVAPAGDGKTQITLSGFIDELAKALAAMTPADQSTTQTSGEPVLAADPQVPPANSQPGSGSSMPSQPPLPDQPAPPGQTELPVQLAPEPLPPDPLPQGTKASEQGDVPSGRPRAAQTNRRDANSQTVTVASAATPTAQPIVAATQVLPTAVPLTDGTPTHATPPASQTHASAEEPTNVAHARQDVAPLVPPQPVIRPAEPAPMAADPVPPAGHATGSNSPTSAPPQTATVDTSGLALHTLPVGAEAVTTTSTASPVSPAPTAAAAASPAAQIAPVLVSLTHAPDGARRLTMRLEPPELGQVQIRIDRPTDAPAHVEITVERTETLTLLLRDQPQLQHALDLAGVPPEGRSVTFHVGVPEPASRADSTSPSPAPGAAAGGLAGDFSRGDSRQGGGPPRRNADITDSGNVDIVPNAATGWMRAGLDITA